MSGGAASPSLGQGGTRGRARYVRLGHVGKSRICFSKMVEGLKRTEDIKNNVEHDALAC